MNSSKPQVVLVDVADSTNPLKNVFPRFD